MDLTQLANLGEFIGGVAVLVTLVYLAVQVRQNTASTRAAARQQMSESSSDQLWQWASSDVLELMQRADVDGLDALSLAEQERFIFAFRAVLNGDLWESRVTRLRLNLSRPGVLAVWRRTAPIFGKRFRNFVDDGVLDAAGVRS